MLKGLASVDYHLNHVVYSVTAVLGEADWESAGGRRKSGLVRGENGAITRIGNPASPHFRRKRTQYIITPFASYIRTRALELYGSILTYWL